MLPSTQFSITPTSLTPSGAWGFAFLLAICLYALPVAAGWGVCDRANKTAGLSSYKMGEKRSEPDSPTLAFFVLSRHNWAMGEEKSRKVLLRNKLQHELEELDCAACDLGCHAWHRQKTVSRLRPYWYRTPPVVIVPISGVGSGQPCLDSSNCPARKGSNKASLLGCGTSGLLKERKKVK